MLEFYLNRNHCQGEAFVEYSNMMGQRYRRDVLISVKEEACDWEVIEDWFGDGPIRASIPSDTYLAVVIKPLSSQVAI